MSIASTPSDSNDENLSPEKPKQESSSTEKKEKPINDERERIFQSFVKKESSSEDDDDKSQGQFQDFTKKFVNEFMKQGGSIGTINFQSGGIHVDGSLYNSGNVVGRNQDNRSQKESEDYSENHSTNLDEHDYSGMSLPEKVEYWFREHQTIHHRSLMIAMAFLNGSDCESITTLSEKLELAIRLKSGKDTQKLSNETLKFKILGFKKRLRIVFAYTESTGFGSDWREIALFSDSSFQEAVLKYIWEEEDYYWHITLGCLLELGNINSLQTKVRLAAALSESCKYRFDLVRELIFLPWANSNNSSQRSLVALSLGITALEDDKFTSQQARDLLSRWSIVNNHSNLMLMQTAVEAYSLYVGLKFPEDALDKFLEIVKSNIISLFSDILEGIVILFERSESTPENRLIILNHFEKWVAYHRKESPYEMATLVTWGIMKTSETTVSDQISEKLPTLLWLSKNDEKASQVVSLLIRYSLNLKLIRFLVIEELKLWFVFVDKEPSLRQSLGKIITRIMKYGNSRERLRLKDYLNRWATQGNSYALTMLTFLQQKELIE